MRDRSSILHYGSVGLVDPMANGSLYVVNSAAYRPDKGIVAAVLLLICWGPLKGLH